MTPLDSAAPEPVPAQPRRRRWLHAGLVLLAVAATVGSLVAWRASQAEKSEKKPEPEKSFEFAQSDLARVTARDLGRVIPVSGTVNPVVSATVRSKLAAEVATIHAQEGEHVAAGKVLVTLEAADLRARLAAQLAAVAEAQARLDLAAKNQASQRQLLSQNFISQNAFDTAQNGVDVAQASLNAAQAQGEIARRALSDAQVRAPFSGIVAKRLVNAGEKVSPDVALMQLMDLTQMELQAQLPVSEIPAIQVGQTLELTVDGFGARIFKGRVGRINPAAEPGTRAITVFVALANGDGALRGGMFAKGRIALGASAPLNTLPVTAIHEEAGQSFVFGIREGKLERRPVQLGNRRDELGLVEVRDGPPAGTEVVAVQSEGLQHGLKASVKSAKP
jgi:RND family efflux transporter MFP subunit